MTTTQTTITLRTGPSGHPESLVWRGQTYEVTDTPTILDWDWSLMTHPPKGLVGWRFQGTNDEGNSRMFEVLFNEERREWDLFRDYT